MSQAKKILWKLYHKLQSLQCPILTARMFDVETDSVPSLHLSFGAVPGITSFDQDDNRPRNHEMQTMNIAIEGVFEVTNPEHALFELEDKYDSIRTALGWLDDLRVELQLLDAPKITGRHSYIDDTRHSIGYVHLFLEINYLEVYDE